MAVLAAISSGDEKLAAELEAFEVVVTSFSGPELVHWRLALVGDAFPFSFLFLLD
jgi:hypothetical protein